MKFGLIHYNAPGETLEAFLSYAADAGFDAVELQSRDVWDESNPNDQPEARAEQVRALCEAKGIAVGAFAACNNFLVTDPDQIAFQVSRMERICQLAKLLGTNVIRSEGGSATDAIPQELWLDTMANVFVRCTDFLEDLGIKLGIDNHGIVTNDAELQLMILGLVSNPHVGLTMDTMNYRWMGYSIDRCNRFYELAAKRAFHVHLKDGRGSRGDYRGEVLGEGEVHLPHAIRALKAAGYDGLWCAEYEGREPDGYTQCLAWMKANIAQIQ